MIWLPIAAALFALNYDTAEWASGGLETSFYTLLILGAFYLWFYSNFSEQRRWLLTGLVFALVSLTRPDGVLFTATAVVLLAVSGFRRKQSFLSLSKNIGILVLPSIVIGIPYLIWKYFYYGDILPLTYYAKSADENYFGQGFFYIWLYFRVHFTSAIALIVGAVLLLRKNSNGEPSNDESYRGSPAITVFVAIVVYLILFVARVGGDFMFARFIIPVVPLVYFIIERGMDRLPVKSGWYRFAAAAILIVVTLLEENLPVDGFIQTSEGKRVEDWSRVAKGSTRYIADERWFYYDYREFSTMDRTNMDVYSEIGKYFEPFFRDLPVTVAIPGAMNMVAYYANFHTCINEYGLADSFIAHSALTARGHIGHEKNAPEAYLQKRNVDFELQEFVHELPKNVGPTTILLEIPDIGEWQVERLVTYNKPLMNELTRRFAAAGNRSATPLFENLIPQYIESSMPEYPLDRVEMDYEGLRQFYFNKYPDTALSNRFEERIAELKRDSIEHR